MLTDFTFDDKTKVLDFTAKEVKDDATKNKIVRPMQYVIIKTDTKDKKETIHSVQTLPGAGPGG